METSVTSVHMRVVSMSECKELLNCPECDSGDVRFCEISVRPHCNECQYWAPINYTGTKQDAIGAWNKEKRRVDAEYSKDADNKEELIKLRKENKELKMELLMAENALANATAALHGARQHVTEVNQDG